MARSVLGMILLSLVVVAGGAAQAQAQTSQPQGAQAQANPAGLDFPRLESEAILWLQGLLRINTTNPPGHDLAAANYLAGVLKKEGIDAEIYKSGPNRGFLVARLQATALPNPSQALLLVSHLDTAGVDASKWKSDPFGGMVQDDYLYGRGAINGKAMAAAEMAVLIALKRSNAHLDRDVIFLADGDGGATASEGMKFVVENYWNKVAAGFAINDGGRVVVKDGKVQYVGIQVDEKVSRNLDVIASGTPGPSSLPSGDDAITHLAAALEKIAAYCTPVHFTFLTRDYFEGVANIEDQDTAKWIRALDDPSRAAHAVQFVSSANPDWGAMMRDTIAPTQLQAGTDANAIPGEARGVVNLRLLPGTLAEELVNKLQQAVNDSQVRLEIEPGGAPPAPASSLDSGLYTTIASAAKQQFPGAAVLPYMSIQSTDSPYLRERSVQTYGLLPFPLSHEEMQRTQGADERIQLDTFRKGMEFLYQIVTNFAVEK